MAGNPKTRASKTGGSTGGDAPLWAQGLRSLYNSVVDEPLPPSLEDLLKRLDKPDGR